MAIKLGDFFPRKALNEPFLTLDDPKWSELEGGYKRTLYNASIALKQLEQAKTLSGTETVYKELWNELHHQGDVGLASYYAVPHLVRIAKQSQLIDSNVLGLVSVIEIQRHKNNPRLPAKLQPAYSEAIRGLQKLAETALNQNDGFDLVTSALSAIALAKGQINLADAIQRLDSMDVIEDFLENY
jgi:hypothetical protein